MYTPWQWESTFVCQCSAWMGHVLRTWENNSRTYLMLHTVLGLSLKVFPQSGIEQGELLFLEIWKHIFFYLNYSYLLQHSKNLILFYRLQKITFLKIFHILLLKKKKSVFPEAWPITQERSPLFRLSHTLTHLHWKGISSWILAFL